MTVIEWDMYLYVVVFVYFIGIIVSGTGAWDYEMLWRRNVEEVLMMMLYQCLPFLPFPGVNRHFHMMCIHEKLNSSISKKISAKQIWQRLSAMFDLQALVSGHEPADV